MLRNKIIAIVALVMIGLVSPTAAFGRAGVGGHGGGSFHGGDVFRGGGFHGGGIGFRAGRSRGREFGFFGPYLYGGYLYDDEAYCEDDGGSDLIRQHIVTRYGWPVRHLRVCKKLFLRQPARARPAGVSRLLDREYQRSNEGPLHQE
jgi:hypothetical protein